MTQQIAIETGADYVNYTFNMEARGVAEVSSELMGLSNTVSNILGQIAFKTSDFLSHTEMMAIGAGAAIGAMFVKASQSAINFQQQIANVKAIGGETIDAQGIGSAAMEYSNKFGMATSEMTEGLESLARAGITSTNVMKQVLGEGVKLSKLEGLDLEDSINDLIATTNLLSEMDVDMNDANYGQLVQAMNQHIVSTSESSPINAQNIIQTLQHVGGYAAAASIDQDDLFAVIAQLGARGTKGEMAGTALRAFIAAPQKDTAQRALDRIGLNVSDLWDESGEAMLPISEVKDVLDDALEKRGYSKQEKLEFYSDFAGYKQANQIMKINTEEVRKYKDDIANAWDLGTKLNTILGTVRGNLDRIWQISQNFMTKVGSQLLIVAEALLTPVRVFLDIFTHIPFADTAVAGIMLFTAFKGGLLIVNKTLPLIASFSSNVFDTAKNSLNIKRQWEGINHQLEKFRNIKTAIQEEDYKTLNEYSEPSRKEKIQLENMVFAQMWRKTQTHKGGVKNFEELPLYAQERYKRRVRHSENFEENYNSLLERIDKNIDTAIDESIDFNFEDAPYKVVLDSISKYVEYIYRAINGEGNSNRDRNAQANILSEVFRNRVDNNNYGNLEFKYRGENGVNQLKWDIYRNSRDIKQRARDFDNVDAGNLTQAQINAHLNAWIGASNKGHQKSTDANISEIRMVFEKGELAHHENPWEGLKDDQIKLMAKSVGLSGYEDFDSRHGGNRAHAARDIYQEFQRQHGNKSLTEQRSIIDRFFEQENDNGETLVKIWQRNFDRPARGPKEILLNRNDIGKKLAEQLGIQTSIGNETYDVFDYIQAHKDNLTEQQKYIIAQTTFLGTQLDNGSTIFQDNQLKFMLEQREMLLNTAKDFDIHADVLGLSDSIRDEVKEVIEAMNADSETLRSGGEALGRALVEGFIVDGLGRHSPGYMFWAYVNEQTDINNAILQSKGIFNESTGLLGLEMTKTFDKNLGLNRVFDSGIEFLSRDADVIQSIISDFDKDNFAVYDPQDLVHTDGTIWEQVDMQDELNLTPEEIISLEQFVRPYGFDVSNFERFGKNFGTQWGQKPRFQSALWYSDYDLLNNSVFLYSDLEDKYGHENVSDFTWLVEEFRHKHGGNWLGFKTSGNIGDFTIDDEIFNDIVQDIENKYFDFLNNIGQNMRNVIKRSDGLFENIKLSRGGRLPTTADEMGEYLGFTSTSFSEEMVERVYGVGGAHQYKTNVFAPEEILGIYPNIETIGRSLILRDGSELNNVYKNQLEYTLGSGQPFIELPNENGDFSGKALKREPDVLLLTPSQIKEIRNIVVDEMSDIINSQSNKKVSDILNSKGLDIASNLNSFQNKGEDISIDDYLLQLDEARKYAKIRNDLQKRRNKKNNKDTGWALNVIKSRYNAGESMPYSSSVLLGESDYYTDLSYINKPGYTEDRVYDLFDTSWLNINHSRYTDGPMGESYGTGHAFLNPGAIKYHIDNYSEEYGNDYGTALLENIVHEATHILADHDMRSSEAYKELYLGGIDDFTTDEDILGYNSNFVAEFEANYVAVKTLEKLGLEASQKAQQRMATFKRMVDNQELENSYNLELLDSLVDSFIMHRTDLLSYVKGIATQFDMVSADTNKMEVVNSLRNVEMALDNTTRSRSVYYGKSIESSYDADKIVSDMAIDILSLNPASYGIDTYEDILKQSIISKYAPIIGLKNAQKGYKYANKRATSDSILDFNSFLLDNFHKEDFIKPELNPNYISSSSDAFNYKWDNNSIKKYMSDLYQSDYQDKTTFGTPAEIEAYSQLLHSKSSLMKNFTETNFNGYESAWVDNYIDSDGLANEKVIYIKNAVEYLNRLFEHSPGAYDNQLLYHGGTLNTNLGGFGQFNLRSLTYDEATSKDHAYSSGRYHQKVYVPAGTQILNPTHSLLGSGWYENESEATVGVAQPYFELNRREADYRSNKPNKAEVLLLGPNQQKDFLDSIGLKSFKNEGHKNDTSKQITLDDIAKQDKEKNTNKASKFCECLRQNMYKEQVKRHHEVKREKYRKQWDFEDIKARTRQHHNIRKNKSDALLKEKERQEKLEELKEKTRKHHNIRKDKSDLLIKQQKRNQEIANLRKQMAEDEKRWLEEGKKYAEEKIKKQKELRERQKKIYQDERKEREEEYIRKRRQEYSHIYGVGVQNAPEDLVKQQQYEEDVAQHSTPGYSSQAYADFQNQYEEMGDYFLMNNFDKARYKLQQEGKDNKWIMKGIDYSERIYNQATNKVRSFTSGQYEKSQQYAQEHGHENLDWASDKLDMVKEGTEQFRDSLASLSEIFPVLTPAVMALDTALAIQEAVSTGLTVATEILTFAKTGETESTFLQTMANWANSESALQAAAGEMALAGATWLASAAEAVLQFLRGLSSAQILLVAAAIAAVIAAIMAVKFWEEQHAKALKESQKALEEATAKNNIALSQYQDLKKARENETDAIKKQQAARKEAIALYELEAARLKKRQAVHDEAEARNDAVWGEYGLRATMQKMGLGFMAGGDFESQYENYEGTTKNIRRVKEDTLGNFETTQEQQYVAAFYDANKMAFAEIDAYKEDLGKLYDVESKLIEKYGSIEDARNSQEFADAVQEFCDATGIQAETAVKYLDWLETENKVNQASKVAEASIAMVRARADAKAAGIDMEYGGFDSENMDDVGRAMVYAQVDQMIKDEKHEMWWTMLWEYLQAIISCLFLNFGEAGKHLQKAEAYQEGVAELEANREQYYQYAMDYYENADRYDYGLGSYSIYADTPFGGAVSSAATQYAENEQQKQYNETGKVMSENEYQAVQTQYQEETFGITEEQLRNQKNQENQKAYEQSKSRSTKNANNTLGQLQNNGAQAHRDALDIIDAIKGKGKAGVVSGLGAGVMSLFDEDNPLFKSLRKKGLRDAFDFMAGEEGTVTEKVVSKGKNIYNEAKAAYGENGLRGVYDYGKQGIKKLGNQGIDFLETKGINIRPYAEQGLDLFRQGKSGVKGLYQSAKAGYAENGIRGALGNIKNSAKSAIYGEAPGMMIMDDGTRVPLGGGKEGLLARGQRGIKNIAGEGRALYQSTKAAYAEGGIGNVLSKGKDALKSTSVSSKITDRIGLAREVNGLAADGVPIARSGLDKAVGVFDGAKAAYAEDGIAGVAKFGKEAGKSGIKGLASDTSGILSKGAEGLKNSYKPGAALGEMASTFNPKNLAGGVGDIAKGLKGGGTLLKGIGKVGGPALMALGPALAFADKASELNPFDGPHYNEDGSEKKALQATGEVVGTTVGAVGGVVGGLEGAAAGAAIGTAILPGIGTAIGAVAGGIAGGWLGDTIFQPIGEAIGGTIGWLGDNLLGGIQNVAGTVWDGLTGAASGVWDAVSGAASGAWDFLTGGGKGDQPVGGLLGLTPIGMGVNAAAGIWDWLSGGDQKNDPYANVENVGQQKNPKSAGQTQNTIVIKNININTEDDPEKIKSALMNLIIEMQEQVNPRQVSRTVGEPPATSNATTDQNQNNTAQAQGTDPQSGTPNGNSTTNTNTNTNT